MSVDLLSGLTCLKQLLCYRNCVRKTRHERQNRTEVPVKVNAVLLPPHATQVEFFFFEFFANSFGSREYDWFDPRGINVLVMRMSSTQHTCCPLRCEIFLHETWAHVFLTKFVGQCELLSIPQLGKNDSGPAVGKNHRSFADEVCGVWQGLAAQRSFGAWGRMVVYRDSFALLHAQ